MSTSNKMSKYIVSAFIVGTLLHLPDVTGTEGCGVHLSHIYSREHANVTFQFTVSPNSERAYGLRYYLGKGGDGSDITKELLQVFPGNTVSTIPSITFIGDVSTGNISLIYKNVNMSEAGVYQLINILGPDIKTQCVSLFILGTPVVPTVVLDRIPDEGEDVVLTCSGSRSTTVPVGHNLRMVYLWTVDDVTNPVNPRYTDTADKEQFIITNVSVADTEKHITCQAIEDVSGGLSSANSKVVAVQIYYGPENIQFDPVNLVYEQNESSQFGPVHCKASCFPACTYRWHKNEAGGQASNNGTLYINRLKSNDAGTYFCNATNPGRFGRTQYTDTKQLNISVIYGPRNIALSPPTTLYHHLEGYNMTSIQCTSECYMCRYTWTGPTMNSAGGKFDIGVLTRSLHGRYTCTAVNNKTGNSLTSEVVVEVVFGPDNMTFDPSQYEYEEVENTTLPSINCTTSCYPACTYTWEKIGETGQIGVDGILNLGYLQRSMAGIYRCTVTNPGRVDSGSTTTKDLTLHVKFGPDNIKFDPPQDEYEEVENTTLPSINCMASCYPACTYTWEKIDQTGQIVGDGILNLGYLQRSKAGIYRCTVTNLKHVGGSGSMAKRNLSLHVIYGPEMADISKGHSLTVTEGIRQVNITCTSDCYPSCTSTWISITGGSADVSGDVLSLGQVTRNHTGKYKCTTSNTDPGYQVTANATIDITVYYAPNITVAVLPNTELVENNYTELRCNTSGVPNNYNYVALTQTWGNATIPNPRPQISTTPLHSSLRFDSLRLDDTGTYTCVANNGVRDDEGILNQTSTIGILVQVSPKILTKTLTFACAKSGNVRINVPFYSVPPANSINFTRQDGVQIQNSSRTTVSYELSPVITKFYGEDVTLNGSIAYLQITNIQETDFTNYTLDVTNTLGRNRTIIYLIHQNAPNKPTSFNRHVGETEVVVSWEAGFHGGNNQTFVIQLSKDRYVWLNHSFVFGGKNTTGFKMNSTLDKLSKGTQYYVRIYAFNINGSSAYTDVLNFTTNPEVSTVPPPQFAPVIGGVVGIVIILAIGAVVAIVVFKRRNGTLRGKKKDDMIKATHDREGPYTSMQYSTGSESEYLELNREQERSSNGNNTTSQEGPYTSMQYSMGNESEYLEISREQGQQQTDDRNVYVNLQLNAQ